MAELIVIAFDDAQKADRALAELQRLEREYLVDLEDAVVAIREPGGKLRLKQSVDLTGMGAASGGLWGAMWGSLVGLLFLNPLIGLVTGAALGAGAGALSANLGDYGIDDDFIKSLGNGLTPGTSAIFILVRKVQPEKVLQEFSGFGGKIIRSSLAPDQERRLQEALAGSASMPGTRTEAPTNIRATASPERPSSDAPRPA